MTLGKEHREFTLPFFLVNEWLGRLYSVSHKTRVFHFILPLHHPYNRSEDISIFSLFAPHKSVTKKPMLRLKSIGGASPPSCTPPKLLLCLEGLEKSTINLRTAGDPAEHKNNVRLLFKLHVVFFNYNNLLLGLWINVHFVSLTFILRYTGVGRTDNKFFTPTYLVTTFTQLTTYRQRFYIKVDKWNSNELRKRHCRIFHIITTKKPTLLQRQKHFDFDRSGRGISRTSAPKFARNENLPYL